MVQAPSPSPALPPEIAGGIQADQQFPPLGGQPPAPPPPPTQHPSFFRNLLFSLGQGLIEGTKAGMQAPLGPQGPPTAARIAINAPQQERERMTTNKLNDLNVAITQLKLHQMHTMVMQEDEDRQNAAYNKGADTSTALVEKGKVDVLATGDLKGVQAEYQRRMADAKDSGQGLLPLQILPAPGSSAKDPQYALIMVGKDRLTEGWEENWGPGELGIDKEKFDAAGVTQFKFKAPQGMDQQKALQLHATQFQNWWTKSTQALAQMERTKAQQAGAGARAKLAGDVRLKVADMNNNARFAAARLKEAKMVDDKTVIAAVGKFNQADKNLKDSQGKIGNRAWETVTGKETKEITTAREAYDQAWTELQGVIADRKAARATAGQAMKDLGVNLKPMPRNLISQYKMKAGGDKEKAKQLARNDGYDPDTVQ